MFKQGCKSRNTTVAIGPSISKNSYEVKKDFKNLLSKSTDLSFQDLENKIPEPHPSWVKVIEEGWIARYGSIN